MRSDRTHGTAVAAAAVLLTPIVVAIMAFPVALWYVSAGALVRVCLGARSLDQHGWALLLTLGPVVVLVVVGAWIAPGVRRRRGLRRTLHAAWSVAPAEAGPLPPRECLRMRPEEAELA